MKKIILSIVAIAAASLSSYADTTLSEAYKSLSSMPGMSEKTSESIQVSPNTAISDVKTSSVASSSSNVQEYRDKFIYMMENLPVRNMVIGANNQRELAAVYATPSGGAYDVLIVTGNVLSGNFSVSYGKACKAAVKALNNGQLSMDSDQLVLTTAPGSNASFVSMNE